MTLTEEQRAALKRVAAYMDEMYSVASPYHGCTEDSDLLRAMIDSSGTVEPTGGFDLERARGLRDFLQDDCAEVGDVWGEMIAEIERLRGYEIAARDLSADLTKVAGARDEQAARIKELEDAHKRSGAKYAKIINELRSSVYANIPGLDVGKIGPDAKPRVWQITEERIGLLEYCLETLLDAPDIEEIPGPGHSIEMLRAMLREAEQ